MLQKIYSVVKEPSFEEICGHLTGTQMSVLTDSLICI